MSTTTLPQPQVTTKPNFGTGRYSALMEESWSDAQVIFGLDTTKAEKLARQIASDFGAIMANARVDARIGKAINKNGKTTLSEAAKIKNVTVTNALFAMRAIAWANEMGKFGFIWADSKLAVGKSLTEYFDTL